MTNPTETPSENQTLKRTVAIRVLGVGDAGCNVVNHLARESLDGVSCALVNTNARALAQMPVPAQLNLGSKTMRGLGAGGDPERGRAAAEADTAAIRHLCAGADVVFVVAGLGGGTGTGAAPVAARVARETGALVFGVVILPFECEGSRREQQAQLGLHELKKSADGVICLPNQRMLKLIDGNTGLLEGLSITNELIAQGVRGIWRLLSRPGLINVDFASLCAVAQGKHAESSLASVEARGDHRTRDIMDKLLTHPLLAEGQALAEAVGVLVSIVGGPGLTMAEVNWMVEQINRQAEQAHIIMGAAIEAELGDRLQVTLVASRQGQAEGASRSDLPAQAAARLFPELQPAPLDTPASARPPSRFVAPAPELTTEQTEELWTRQNSGSARQRRQAARLRQGQLPLEIISKGRFEKSEPTIHEGQDLDVPTYIRRGVALN